MLQVLKRERPDGIVISMGGQTALNCAVALHRAGIFEKYNVAVMGTPVEAIMATEDRDIFKDKVLQVVEVSSYNSYMLLLVYTKLICGTAARSRMYC
jgi:carbamoyl-phosphate synthase large subunit